MPDARPASVFSVALLVAGTAIGAGVLGIPIKTGLAGMVPALVGMIVVWLALLGAGLILARSLVSRRAMDEDLPSVFRRELGPLGKWLATVGYLIIFYGLLTAYLAGSVSVLSSLLDVRGGKYLLLAAFFVPATVLALFGLPVVRRGNALFMAILVTSFLFLLVMAGRGLDPTRLVYADWSYFPEILPIITCSLGYGVIIPSACRSLDGDMKRITKALVWGTLIPLGISLLLIVAVLGAVPLQGNGPDSLFQAFLKSQPATVPLAETLGSTTVIVAGLVFSLCAILTSYLAVGTALMGFHQDLLGPLLPRRNYWIRAALVFLPPLVVVIVSPGLFLTALDLVGGLGIALIFGLGPALIQLKRRGASPRNRLIIGVLLLAFFGVIIGLELGQELGWLKLDPTVKSWKINHPSPQGYGR